MRGRLGLLIIDYLQLIEADKSRQNRAEEVGRISRALKRLALELDVPVIALSQLNRAVETRANGKPQLSDLRESGSIEQDADTVALLHAPAEPKGVIEVTLAKNRHGPQAQFKLAFDSHFVRFRSFEDYRAMEDVAREDAW